MSENAIIVCKPTQWIKIRAVLIILMFGVFAFLFYKDGTIGYCKQNEQILFKELITEVAVVAADDYSDEASWQEFAKQQDLNTAFAQNYPLPKDFDGTQSWPQVLIDGYTALKSGSKEQNDLWLSYSDSRGWPEKVADHPHEHSDLQTQYYMAAGSAAVVLFVLFVFVRILMRDMRVTETAFIAPGGEEIPFTAMRRIDARKWDVKGVATIFYEAGGVTKKAKVDGMIYGQFKKEEGEPAEKLYAHILEHFKGELIEFEKVDNEEEGEQLAAEG